MTEEALRKKEEEQEKELERAKREHAELLAKQKASHSDQYDRALRENEEKLKKFQELHDHKHEKHAAAMAKMKTNTTVMCAKSTKSLYGWSSRRKRKTRPQSNKQNGSTT